MHLFLLFLEWRLQLLKYLFKLISALSLCFEKRLVVSVAMLELLQFSFDLLKISGLLFDVVVRAHVVLLEFDIKFDVFVFNINTLASYG